MSLADIKHINPSSVLDIGAGVGDWYREAKALWPAATYLLIEGNPNCLPALVATQERVMSSYLGDSIRTVSLYKRLGGGTDTGNSYYRELTPFFADDQIIVQQIRLEPLSSLLPKHLSWELCKIDTQGSELDIIRGGIETFKRANHILLEVSFERYNEGAPLADEIFKFMDELGFPKRQEIGDIVHPISRTVVQKDVLFSK